jgi:arsenate reductase-like glutaredoxin family protein
LPEYVIANKVKLDRDAAFAQLEGVDRVLVARGKKLLRFDLSADVDQEELAAVILGRSGTLRAPAIQVGTTFVVGFHAEGYEEVF